MDLPAEPDDAFDDDDGNTHELAINQLAALGVIGDNGEDGSSYFPDRTLTRGEMASFLNGLIEAVTGERLASDDDAFPDDDDSDFEAYINGLAAAEIVRGRTTGSYDPDDTVQRDAMASYLVRTYTHLVNATPADAPAPNPSASA